MPAGEVAEILDRLSPSRSGDPRASPSSSRCPGRRALRRGAASPTARPAAAARRRAGSVRACDAPRPARAPAVDATRGAVRCGPSAARSSATFRITSPACAARSRTSFSSVGVIDSPGPLHDRQRAEELALVPDRLAHLGRGHLAGVVVGRRDRRQRLGVLRPPALGDELVPDADPHVGADALRCRRPARAPSGAGAPRSRTRCRAVRRTPRAPRTVRRAPRRRAGRRTAARAPRTGWNASATTAAAAADRIGSARLPTSAPTPTTIAT